jgi:DNA-directed RNA polymerase specialized sigma subunit
MNKERMEARNKLRNIIFKTEFESLLEDYVLTDEDKELMRLHYLKGKDFRFIADALGYSEIAIKKRHAKILTKISKLI